MYSHVFVAGTFDPSAGLSAGLHDGHELLLTRAFETGEKVTIGLTSDEFVAKFKILNSKFNIQPYESRKQHLLHWIKEKGYFDWATLIPINDPYEPAASMPDLEVLVVTPDNKVRGEEINEKRKNKGLAPLALLVVPLVAAQDTKPISSTRVRMGEIDRTGRLILPDNLRPELVKPLGTVLTGDGIGSSIEKRRNGIIITVGDMTAKTMLTAGVVPNLIIVDFHVGRKPYPDNDEKFNELNLFRITLNSGPGFIANDAVNAIRKWATHPSEKMILAVAGEEDLLTLPVVVYAPVGAVVYYGQPARIATQSVAGGPEQGMVEVVVNADKKREAEALLSRFT